MNKQYTRPEGTELDVSHSTIVVAETVAKLLATKFQGTAKELHKVTDVQRHAKRFDTLNDVKSTITGTGTIRVIARRVQNVRREAGYTIGDVQFVAFILVNDQYGENRDQRAELIASRLGVEVLSPSFSQSLKKFAHKAVSSCQWENITTQAFDEIGVSMFAVQWSQECRLNVPVDESEMDDFLVAFMTADIAADAPLMEAKIELEQEPTNA
ncbi:hypothetical protein RJD40_20795 [Vibrio scophthalmi]|uniref:hypothetical protein n=1 Tax=Vibrio scophthalmi TaxID=45658 RepID=UPI003AAF9CA5